MAMSMVHLIAGTPTITWCDKCMTGTRARLEFHALNTSGVTRALVINRCVNERHDDE